jgi:CPA1 family monovalent cation:H+ antiporter
VRLAIVAPWGAYYHLRESDPGATQLLAWGGLRGGLSLALALGTPEGPQRAALISLTYAVVAFSVVVQGLSFGPLADKLRQAPATET